VKKINLIPTANATQTVCAQVGIATLLLFSSVLTAQAQAWSNTNSTFPPDASQNWATGTNWVGNAVPNAGNVTISNGGAALVNTAVPSVSTVILGNSANASLTHSLYIANGGSLNVTSTAPTAFRVISIAGVHRVTIESGGSLAVAGTITTTAGAGSTPILTSAGTITATALRTHSNAETYITGGSVTLSQNFSSIVAGSGGAVQQSGGAVQASNSGSLQLEANGTYRISGGSLSMTNTSAGLIIHGGAGTGNRTFHVNGSGASSIDFGGLRYIAAQDPTSMVWKFTLDNGANHITKVNFTNNGNAGGNFRRGTLDVGLSGGILLSGNSSLTLMEGPTISTATNFTNAADYTSGTAKLWVQSITDSTRDTLNVTLNSSKLQGSQDFSNPIALTFTSAAYGYVNLTNTNLSQPFTLGLIISGGTLSNFTGALTAAGINWTAGTGAYNVNLILNPNVSGGTAFAWDLQSIDGAMGVAGVGVIPEPSTWALLSAILMILIVLRRRTRRDF